LKTGGRGTADGEAGGVCVCASASWPDATSSENSANDAMASRRVIMAGDYSALAFAQLPDKVIRFEHFDLVAMLLD
jgi:hypothetical protein